MDTYNWIIYGGFVLFWVVAIIFIIHEVRKN